MLRLVRIEKSENIDDGFHDKDKPMNFKSIVEYFEREGDNTGYFRHYETYQYLTHYYKRTYKYTKRG